MASSETPLLLSLQIVCGIEGAGPATRDVIALLAHPIWGAVFDGEPSVPDPITSPFAFWDRRLALRSANGSTELLVGGGSLTFTRSAGVERPLDFRDVVADGEELWEALGVFSSHPANRVATVAVLWSRMDKSASASATIFDPAVLVTDLPVIEVNSIIVQRHEIDGVPVNRWIRVQAPSLANGHMGPLEGCSITIDINSRPELMTNASLSKARASLLYSRFESLTDVAADRLRKMFLDHE